MLVEIVSDPVCPWCFLGKRRFDAALARRGQLHVELHWLPFELNPAMPEDGLPRDEYLAAKFGGLEALRQAEQRIVNLGTEAGIHFRFDLIRKSPNTRAAHVLSRIAAEHGRQAEVQEALFVAYFEAGEDIGDQATLLRIATTAGLDAGTVRERLVSRRDWPQLDTLENELRAAGVSGVPFFIFDRRYAVSGAQETVAFEQALDRAAAGTANS